VVVCFRKSASYYYQLIIVSLCWGILDDGENDDEPLDLGKRWRCFNPASTAVRNKLFLNVVVCIYTYKISIHACFLHIRFCWCFFLQWINATFMLLWSCKFRQVFAVNVCLLDHFGPMGLVYLLHPIIIISITKLCVWLWLSLLLFIIMAMMMMIINIYIYSYKPNILKHTCAETCPPWAPPLYVYIYIIYILYTYYMPYIYQLYSPFFGGRHTDQCLFRIFLTGRAFGAPNAIRFVSQAMWKGASAVAAGRVLVVAICCTMSKSFSSDFLQCVSRDMEVAKQMRQPKCDAWCSSFTRKGACEWCHIRENIG
jgi:hypothetical protein